MPELTFDPEGIHHALLNVVTNAIDACEGGESRAGRGRDSLRYRPKNSPGSSSPITVPGSPEEDRARIFNLFESTKGHGGTGLGLSVSQKILQEHGGEIVVESELGCGSSFTLELPTVHPDELITGDKPKSSDDSQPPMTIYAD